MLRNTIRNSIAFFKNNINYIINSFKNCHCVAYCVAGEGACCQSEKQIICFSSLQALTQSGVQTRVVVRLWPILVPSVFWWECLWWPHSERLFVVCTGGNSMHFFKFGVQSASAAPFPAEMERLRLFNPDGPDVTSWEEAPASSGHAWPSQTSLIVATCEPPR